MGLINNVKKLLALPNQLDFGVRYVKETQAPFDHPGFIRRILSRNVGGLIINERRVFKGRNGAESFAITAVTQSSDAITKVNQGTPSFAVSTDKTAIFPVGKKFLVNSSTGNDAVFTVSSSIATLLAAGSHSFGSGLAGAGAAGLAAATYDINITVDGIALRTLTIVIGGAENHNAVATLIQVVLRAAEGASSDTVVISGGAYLVTSEASGIGTSILIAAGTSGSGGGDILAALNVASAGSGDLNIAIAGTDNETVIVVNETIPDGTVDGNALINDFTIAGNNVSKFSIGTNFNIISSTGNDGKFTVGGVQFNINTVITPTIVISDSTADGTINIGELIFDKTYIPSDGDIIVSTIETEFPWVQL